MSLSRSARFRIGASLLIGGALVACALDPLNPQPLPPSPEALADGGVFSPTPDASRGTDSVNSDAASANDPDGGAPPPEAADDAGDAGDAGDADADADAKTTP